MLIDDVTIKIKAGDGGKGAVAFNKNLMSLGPVGGDGGDGGNLYFEGVSDLSALAQFRYRKEINTPNGGHGKPQFNDGPDGGDLILKIPVGTIIQNIDTGQISEITKIGQRILAARGGHGGKGNFKFRSARNTTPKQFQPGLPGEVFTVRLELKLIADIGLVGLPNAGKSSLINELTKAKSRVANYPFTTLEPNLGAYYELILADIPGLIEGASKGKGLGIKFLRHIERTKILVHLIDPMIGFEGQKLTSSALAKQAVKNYQIIRQELAGYSSSLLQKPEIVVVTKIDITEIKKALSEIVGQLKFLAGGSKVPGLPISALSLEGLTELKKELARRL